LPQRIPFERHGFYFFARRRPDEQRAVICRHHGVDARDEVLVDANSMSPEHMLGVHIPLSGFYPVGAFFARGASPKSKPKGNAPTEVNLRTQPPYLGTWVGPKPMNDREPAWFAWVVRAAQKRWGASAPRIGVASGFQTS
jgi:hypothetical protein